MPKSKKKKSKNKSRKIINKNFKFTLSEIIIIVVISISLGAILGGTITYGSKMITFSKAPKELDEFIDTYTNITNNYYEKVDKKKVIDAAIEGMINSLEDPFSNYFDEDSTETFNQTVDGEFVGIGVSIAVNDDKCYVVSVFDGSPSSKAGIKKDDIITKINGKDIKGKTIDEIVKLVSGKVGTTVEITILRNDKEKTFKLERSEVDIPSVSSKIYEKNNTKIGYIKIDVFSANTYEEFKDTLEKLEKKNIKALTIDVRDNAGGHLKQVTKILELFMNRKKVLYQIENNKAKVKIYSTTKEQRKYKVSVLINKHSASASEILASAFKESYKSEIVGQNSYGKGTVQRAYELNDGTSLKYTTQKWLTPKGNWINGKGVEPTKVIELNDNYKENPTPENDNQLQEALDTVSK